MDDSAAIPFEELAGEVAVLGVYRQVFAVLAREAGAMILDASLVDVDESILASFAEAGPEGLTVDQVVAACRLHEEARVRRRFEVLRDYRAIAKVNQRPNELFHQAAFAPYVMLLFLRRLADSGGQSELHRLLTLEHLSVSADDARMEDGLATAQRLTTVFRLLANQLAILASAAVVETLRENAQMLWGNQVLLRQADEVHQVVLAKWPELDRDCRALRLAVAAYRDAVDAAAGRLIEQAGTTRALGLLPVEAWRTFARRSDTSTLAHVLDGFVFDAPAPWFTTEMLIEAVEAGLQTPAVRVPPPRPQTDTAAPADTGAGDDEAAALALLAEQLLGERVEVSVVELLDELGDWPAGRRLLSQLTAIHQHDDLPYGLRWCDGLRICATSSLTWVGEGWFFRIPAERAPQP